MISWTTRAAITAVGDAIDGHDMTRPRHDELEERYLDIVTLRIEIARLKAENGRLSEENVRLRAWANLEGSQNDLISGRRPPY